MTRDLGEQQKPAGAEDVHQGQRTGMRRRRTPHVDALNVGKGERVFRPGKARGHTEQRVPRDSHARQYLSRAIGRRDAHGRLGDLPNAVHDRTR